MEKRHLFFLRTAAFAILAWMIIEPAIEWIVPQELFPPNQLAAIKTVLVVVVVIVAAINSARETC